MKVLSTIVDVHSCWIDAVANALITLGGRISPPQIVKLVENESGDFIQTGEEGPRPGSRTEYIQINDGRIDLTSAPKLAAMLPRSQVELTLRPRRFLFRPIELPSRAAEFLEGIVRAQIDRLTPWHASETAFGWSNPVQNGTDRMAVNLAVTTQNLIEPYLKAIANVGAYSISVFAAPPNAVFGDQRIKIWEEKSGGPLKLRWIRDILLGVLAFAAITLGISIGASSIIGAQYDAQRQEIEHRIANFSSAAQAAKNAPSTAMAAVRQDLARRKKKNLSSVVILEILSRILPHHTYLTELRIEGNKLRLVGITKDAPSLISLMEQSDYFSHASFFAPTTRMPSNTQERFHIEAIIQPLVSLRS